MEGAPAAMRLPWPSLSINGSQEPAHRRDPLGGELSACVEASRYPWRAVAARGGGAWACTGAARAVLFGSRRRPGEELRARPSLSGGAASTSTQAWLAQYSRAAAGGRRRRRREVDDDGGTRLPASRERGKGEGVGLSWLAGPSVRPGRPTSQGEEGVEGRELGRGWSRAEQGEEVKV
jgi:hypothetical protein